MKIISTWLIVLIILILPVITDLFIPFDFSDWRKIISYYSTYGFIPFMIGFAILNRMFNINETEKYILTSVALFLAFIEFAYLVILLLNDEFV